MEKDSVVQALVLISAAYPNFYKNNDKQAAVELWSIMFADDDPEEVLLAIKAHIATNKWPPTVADIREAIVKVNHKTITSDEAWGQIKTAIQRCGYSRADEVDIYVSPEVMPILKRMGFKELCMSQNQMADRAHFMKMWDANQKNVRYNQMMPVSLTKSIEARRGQLISVKDMLIIEEGKV